MQTHRHLQHTIQWDSAQIMDREDIWFKRRVKEALRIQEERQTMNLDNGLNLNPIWYPLQQ